MNDDKKIEAGCCSEPVTAEIIEADCGCSEKKETETVIQECCE